MKEIMKIKTPEQLLKYLKNKIKYGVIDENGNGIYDCSLDEFQVACKKWQLRSCEKILKDGIGHCYDFTEVERFWFSQNRYEFKTFWVCAYDSKDIQSAFSHAYLVYKDKHSGKWIHFEVSDSSHFGLHEYNDVMSAVKQQAIHQVRSANDIHKPIGEYKVELFEFKAPKEGCTIDEYVAHCTENELREL